MTWETGERLTYIFKLGAVSAQCKGGLPRNSPRHRQSQSSYRTALLPPQRIQATHPGVGCLPIPHWQAYSDIPRNSCICEQKAVRFWQFIAGTH